MEIILLYDTDLFDIISSDIQVFDFEELRTMPEYKGKSNIECVEEFLKDRYPYNHILNCYNATDGKIYSQIEPDNSKRSNKTQHSCQ